MQQAASQERKKWNAKRDTYCKICFIKSETLFVSPISQNNTQYHCCIGLLHWRNGWGEIGLGLISPWCVLRVSHGLMNLYNNKARKQDDSLQNLYRDFSSSLNKLYELQLQSCGAAEKILNVDAET